MKGKPTRSTLQRGLLLFWSVYFLIISLTNSFDVLVTLGFLPFDFPAVSNNYLLVEKTISIYRLPHRVSDLLFFSVIAWEAIASILFFRAFLFFYSRRPGEDWMIYEAFIAGTGLFCAFILACEIFIVYEFEGAHLRLFLALLLSLVFVMHGKRDLDG